MQHPIQNTPPLPAHQHPILRKSLDRRESGRESGRESVVQDKIMKKIMSVK